MDAQLIKDIPPLYIYLGGVFFLVVLLVLFFSGKKTKTEDKRIAAVQEAPRGIQSLLLKTQQAFTAQLDALILKTKSFDKSFLDSLEEILYSSDLGPKTVEKLLETVRVKASRNELSDLLSVKTALYNEILQILNDVKLEKFGQNNPWVILVVGVNGVGKTTSIGKLAQHYANTLSKSVLVVAGDTFRAAAEAQLAVWGERAKVDVYTSDKTKDAAAVAFQGIQKGVADKKEVIIIDTAGRLHNKENLMEELRKVKRVMEKALPGAPHETILVIDGNSGQNAKIQAQQFNEALGLTSLIVTKLDGTAKGGVIVGIADEVGVGVQFIGTGEQIGDLQAFSNQDYAKGLLRL